MKKTLVALAVLTVLLTGCSNPEEEAKTEYNQAKIELLSGSQGDYETSLLAIAEKYPQTSTATQILNELSAIKAAKDLVEKQGTIAVLNLKGAFMSNQETGEILVINGIVENRYPSPRSSVKVVGQLLDKEGGVLTEQSAFCGNSIGEDTLKSSPLNGLQGRMNKDTGVTLKPGKTLPFTIVFSPIPDLLSEFVVTVE